MADEKTSKFMLMVHKDFSDRTPTKVLKSQFERRWKEKGWEEFKEKESSSTTSSTSTTTSTGGNKDK